MQYGLIGERLGHSFSREVHARLGDYPYELVELAPEEVDGFMRARDFRAINVTIPYKSTVIPYLDRIDAAAQAIGAVNTVKRVGDKLYGYNTDFAGLCELVQRTGVDLRGLTVLILGSGGTAKTALAVCRHLGAHEVLTVSHTVGEGVITYDEAYAAYAHAEFILNATPVGMYPKQDACPIDISRFPRLRGVVDVIYNPARTDLVLAARERGLPAAGGLYMLVAQAIHASAIFMDAPIPTERAEEVFRSVWNEKENVFLIGMPGCGKSTVGRRLAAMMDRPFLDIDNLIVEKTGKPIPKIFAAEGEAGFRLIEEDVIRETAGRTRGAVIATGGGAVLRDGNVRAMRRVGRIYFLDRDIDCIRPTDDRPLSKDRAALLARYRERYPIYCRVADRRIFGDESIESRAKTIRKDFLAQ